MSFGISMRSMPEYSLSAFRKFTPKQRHITRVESHDILLIMLNGVLRFTEDGKPVELCRGEYYIQRSGLFQDGPEVSECPEYFFLHFKGGVWTDDAPFLPYRGTCDPEGLLFLLGELDNAENADAPSIVKNGLFYTLLTQLYRGNEPGGKKAVAEHMARMLTKDLKAPPTLACLSSYFHFSENYLIRIFKASMGTTPHAYVNSARLRKAKILLSSGNITSEMIAYECGFADYAHFYRIFRRETGISPKEYRQRKNDSKLIL